MEILSRREQVLQALYAANKADEAYSQIIINLYGPKATRWTLTANQATHPRVIAAFKAKLDADANFLTVFENARKNS